jgi:hypothetical protein
MTATNTDPWAEYNAYRSVCSDRRRAAMVGRGFDPWPTSPHDSDPPDFLHPSRTTHASRMREWFGLRPRRGHLHYFACPRMVVSKRCHWHRDNNTADCPCQRHRQILDHSRAWIDKHGNYVNTAEPYKFDGQQIAALVAELDTLGIELYVSGMSLWYPGNSVLLAMRARDRIGEANG